MCDLRGLRDNVTVVLVICLSIDTPLPCITNYQNKKNTKENNNIKKKHVMFSLVHAASFVYPRQ